MGLFQRGNKIVSANILRSLTPAIFDERELFPHLHF